MTIELHPKVPSLRDLDNVDDDDLLVLLERIVQQWMDRDNDVDELHDTIEDAVETLED